MSNPEVPPAASPADAGERIIELDILRGMALFGILAANMRGFSAPMDVYFDIGKMFSGRADQIAQFAIDVFIQGKFVTLFSFLFGMGFAAQMARTEARGGRFLSFYPRRLAALALFGLVHGIVIWAGDILLTYAITGTLLLFLRQRSQRFLSRFALFGLSGVTVVMTVFSLLRALGLRKPPTPEKIDLAAAVRAVQIYSHGSWADFFRQNWQEWTQELPNLRFSLFAVILFTLGLWVYRQGIVERLSQYRPTLMRVCTIALPLGLALNLLDVVLSRQYAEDPRPTFIAWVSNLFGLWGTLTLSTGYATAVALLLLNHNWAKRLMPFAAVGRMALTNYLSQSILCLAFFRLTHLYGIWGPALDLLPTVVLFALQMIFSNWWLRRYRFGPMEWLWRRLTYGNWPEIHQH